MHATGEIEPAGPQSWQTVEDLCDRYRGGRPSQQALAILKAVENQRPEVRDFTERGFRLMAVSKFDPRDISPPVAQFFAVLAPAILPGAWGGIVPPITVAGRHKKIDAYLRTNSWCKFVPGNLLLEMGCGFPPQTAMDAAEAFPDWQIVGADPAFEDYMVYDENGNYASLDASGKVRYFQAVRAEDFFKLYEDRNATIARFADVFTRISPSLPADGGAFCSAEQDGMRLVRHPLRQFERPNLHFISDGFGSANLPEAGIVRAMNVLIYYDADFRRNAEEWVSKILRAGGLFVCGRDDAATINAHYTVYRKERDRLVEREFAFGIELVRQPAWYAVQEGDRETWRLAELVGLLRSDREFLRDYDARLDSLLLEHKISTRDENGCIINHPELAEPAKRLPSYLTITETMQQEFTDRAVVSLKRAGKNAWRNPVGHVAVSG